VVGELVSLNYQHWLGSAHERNQSFYYVVSVPVRQAINVPTPSLGLGNGSSLHANKQSMYLLSLGLYVYM